MATIKCIAFENTDHFKAVYEIGEISIKSRRIFSHANNSKLKICLSTLNPKCFRTITYTCDRPINMTDKSNHSGWFDVEQTGLSDVIYPQTNVTDKIFPQSYMTPPIEEPSVKTMQVDEIETTVKCKKCGGPHLSIKCFR